MANVLAAGDDFQVLDPVVVPDPVLVVDHILLWDRADEGCGYKAVDYRGFSFVFGSAECDGHVPVTRRNQGEEVPCSRIRNSYIAANAPKTGDAVVFEPFYFLEPFHEPEVNHIKEAL